MNREIKFRGKDTITKEFVYGDLLQQKLTDGVVTTAIVQTYATYDVDPETVGQFTGLHDINGNEIYEGDIIKGRHIFEHLVRYNNERAQFTATLLEYVGDRMERSWEGSCEQKWIDEFDKEVVGNIHENKLEE